MPIDASPTAVLARIEDRLTALRMSALQASRAAGGDHIIPNLRKGSAPSLDKLVRLAEVLETTPGWLAFGINGDDDDVPVELTRVPVLPPLDSLPIMGEFAAGLWHDVDMEIDESPYEGIPVPPDPAYEAKHQFAGVVKGTSVNRAAPDGSVFSAVDLIKAKIRPRNGDLVAVEQTRHGGHQRMRTIKRYEQTRDGFNLWPDSDDPKWREPLRFKRNTTAEGTTIVILGVVTWVHRRLDRSERPRTDEAQSED